MVDWVEVRGRCERLRLAAGLSQKELAKRLKVSQPTIWGYENDNTNMMASTVYTICEFYNVSADWLLGLGENRIYPEE